MIRRDKDAVVDERKGEEDHAGHNKLPKGTFVHQSKHEFSEEFKQILWRRCFQNPNYGPRCLHWIQLSAFP